MVKIYTSPSCSSCRKVREWFQKQNIPFEEKSIFAASLNEKDILEILTKSENGTEDIISYRSKILKENHISLEDMTTKEIVKFILQNPSVLKRPIMVDDRRIQVGYNEEEIRTFIPPEVRRLARLHCSKEYCEKFEQCEHKEDWNEK